MKVCSKCNIEKDLEEFHKKRDNKDGHRKTCKKCRSEDNKRYKKMVDEKFLAGEFPLPETKLCIKCKVEKDISRFPRRKGSADGCRNDCNDCHLEGKKRYHSDHKEKLSEKAKKRYVDNRDSRLQKAANYRKENKEKIRLWQQANKDYFAFYARNKRQDDIEYRIACNLRGRVRHALFGNGKSITTEEFLGCNFEHARAHLESQFTDGMSWGNYGFYGWHIDHIIPCASFDLTDPDQQRQCFHYTNLQPLWAEDNIRKKDKLPESHQPELPIAI